MPCHRVVAANGRLGGYSAPGGTTTKRRLLELEGAAIVAAPAQALASPATAATPQPLARTITLSAGSKVIRSLLRGLTWTPYAFEASFCSARMR